MIFVDSDIFLDTILIRMPHAVSADQLFFQNGKVGLQLATSAHCLSNVYYFARKTNNKDFAKSLIADLLKTIKVFAVEESHLIQASTSSISDFEDAVQHAVAVANNCRYLITRNLSDYKHAELPVLTAEQFLNTL